MKLLTFANRNLKEILRDPLNLAFGIGFPAVVLLLLSAIQANIPVSLFEIDSLAPGITVFGLSFITLFSATLLAKDRESAFLQRLYTSPLTSAEFIFGYALPLIPIAVCQSVICYLISFALGLKPTSDIPIAILTIIPVSLFFIFFGLMCGCIFNVKQVGGFCGALFTNLAAWLSGIWFSLDTVGGVFKKIAYMLPFVHAVDMEKAAVAGNFGEILPHFIWVAGYTAVVIIAAVLLFLRQMRSR